MKFISGCPRIERGVGGGNRYGLLNGFVVSFVGHKDVIKLTVLITAQLCE